MMQHQIVRVAEIDQFPVVAGQRLQPVVGGLDEDLRLVALRAQDALNSEGLMPDSVAVAERRQDLVNLDHREGLLLRRCRLYPRR